MDKEFKLRNTDEYINRFPKDIQARLQQLRSIIMEADPWTTESKSYGMPSFSQHGKPVYFAAYKNHIGFYPTPSGIKFAETELQSYNYSKGAIQFPVEQELPEELIRRIVKFRVIENKKKKKKSADRN